MRIVQCGRALIVALYLTGTLSAAQAEVSSLTGVTKVRVIVGDLDENTRRAGLTVDRLRTIAELKLRLGGVRVLSREENLKDPVTNPELSVVIMCRELRSGGGFAYTVDLRLRLLVHTPINSALTDAILWESDVGLGTAPPAGMPRSAEETFSAMLDEFLNALLAANPRRP